MMSSRIIATWFASTTLAAFIFSCDKSSGISSQSDYLYKTWKFEAIEGSLDPTDKFNLEQKLDGYMITLKQNKNSPGTDGTYSFVAPNNMDEPSGSGTWTIDGSADNVLGFFLDPGTPDEIQYGVAQLDKGHLHLEVGTYPTTVDYELWLKAK